jgi:hypothetical protein
VEYEISRIKLLESDNQHREQENNNNNNNNNNVKFTQPDSEQNDLKVN